MLIKSDKWSTKWADFKSSEKWMMMTLLYTYWIVSHNVNECEQHLEQTAQMLGKWLNFHIWMQWPFEHTTQKEHKTFN